MGLLSEGTPLTWEETKQMADHVRKHGIVQFINLYHRTKNITKPCLKWGDEVEFSIMKFDHENRRVTLLLKAFELMEELRQKGKDQHEAGHATSIWHPEYAAYMVEATPGRPYGGLLAHFNMVEANMRKRRMEILEMLHLELGETVMSLTAFPRLGCANFTTPAYSTTPESGASMSMFFPDEVINGSHPRFRTLTRNIRQRRGARVSINVPVFRDENTPRPFKEPQLLPLYGHNGWALGAGGLPQQTAAGPIEDHIYMDCMGFGMGMCCLQVTFQAASEPEARLLHDHLTPLCPIVLALSAATPILRGFLSDLDCRWSVISASVDGRTPAERGIHQSGLAEPSLPNGYLHADDVVTRSPPHCVCRCNCPGCRGCESCHQPAPPRSGGVIEIPKSRYDSTSSYLHAASARYNDSPLVYDRAIYDELRSAGIDHLLAEHVAHMFVRDTVSLFSEKIHQDDTVDTDHFENIYSTNWQSMRFKPPPSATSDIGWRVEFRPCELQLTDFENAAFVCFVVLLTRAILSFNLSFLLPISKVDENMRRAQKRDAVSTQQFYFRTNPFASDDRSSLAAAANAGAPECSDDADYQLMSINEIINGQPDGPFPGLVPLIETYLDSLLTECDADTRCTISQYLALIRQRASGKLLTTASWMRRFVRSHAAYRRDSVVTDEIAYDLLVKLQQISAGHVEPDLLFEYSTKSTSALPDALLQSLRRRGGAPDADQLAPDP